MTIDEKKKYLAEINPDMLFADGFEEALIGHVQQFTKSLALYDYEKCVAILMKRDSMTEEEAEEYLQFNTLGAWVGPNTPAFAFFFSNKEAPEDDTQATDNDGVTE